LTAHQGDGVSTEVTTVKTTHGRVRGKTIELDEDLGLAEGQVVELQVKVVPQPRPWGEGLRRCAGALANEWTEDDDRILDEIHQDRKRDTRREIRE
jgi:hypothetical protein